MNYLKTEEFRNYKRNLARPEITESGKEMIEEINNGIKYHSKEIAYCENKLSKITDSAEISYYEGKLKHHKSELEMCNYTLSQQSVQNHSQESTGDIKKIDTSIPPILSDVAGCSDLSASDAFSTKEVREDVQ